MPDRLRPPPPLGGHVALFLDIDGTLIEHTPHPDDVAVDDRLRDLLIAAAHRLDGAVAFVTGRSIAMVDCLFAPLKLPVAGIYGLEHRLRRDGEADLADEPEDLAAVADALQLEFENRDGIYFERKGPVLAIHTRSAPHAFGAVRASAERWLGSLSGYRILAGNAGLEFMPVEALKSAAIRRFMERKPFAGRQPVFLGDDTSDESGFEFVNRHGGVSVRVKPNGATLASYVLASVADVRAWLWQAVSAKVLREPS